MALTISEKSKDRIINSLFMASLILFVVGVTKPSLTSKSEDQPSSTYRAQRLAQLQSTQRPEFSELSAVAVEDSDQNTSSVSVVQRAPVGSSSQTGGSPSATSSFTNTQPTQQISLTTTLNGLLGRVL